jgi:uncharacterized protein involved in exopolysaccharide biosynthesis
MDKTTQSFEKHNLKDTLTILFKHKYLILITFLIIFLTAIFFALKVPKVYEGKSLLLIKVGREYLPRPEETRAGAAPSVSIQTIMNGEVSILSSIDLYARLVNKIGALNLYPELADMTKGNISIENAAIQLLLKDIRVTTIPNSSLIQVTFTHPNPELSAQVVNILVDLFKEKHLEVFSGEGTSFLENQLGTSQKKLKETESNLASFKDKNRVFSFEEQKSALIQQRSTLDASLKTAQSQISEFEQRIAFIKSPQWTVDTAPEMRGQLATLQQREKELLEKYNENSRTVQSLRQEIQGIRDNSRKHSEELRQIELGKVEGELSVVKAKADTLRRQLGQVEGEVRMLDSRGRDLQDLKREAALQEQNYQAYARKLEESLISDDMDKHKMVAISVIEKAIPFRVPKKQRLDKPQLLGGGFFGGIALGIAFAFLLEFMSPGMTTPMSAERRLGIPVMVAITKKE